MGTDMHAYRATVHCVPPSPSHYWAGLWGEQDDPPSILGVGN